MIAATPFANTLAGQYVLPTLVIITAATLIGAFTGLRKLLKQGTIAVAAAQTAADAAQRVADDVTEVKADIKEIRSEIRTNGGSSLKDAIKRTEEQATANGVGVEKMRREAADAYKELRGDLTAHLLFSAAKTAEIETKIQH